MHKTEADHQAEYPEAASAVVLKFYMDDYLDSFQNRDDALKLGRDIALLLVSFDKTCQERAQCNKRS